MSTVVNLLSRHRVDALDRRRRTRAWSLALAAYGIGIFVTWSGFATAMRIPSPAVALADVQSRLDARETEHANLVKAISKLKSQSDLMEGVTDHPDWSLLLALIANAGAQEVGLQRLTLVATPSAATVKGSDIPEHGPWSLALAGAAPSQRSATEFVTRLEKLGIFNSVTLTETRERADAAGGTVQVDFAVLCVLTEKEAPGGRP